MLALSTEHDSARLVQCALDACVEDEAELLAIYVVEPAEDMELVERLSEQLPLEQSMSAAVEVKHTNLSIAMSRLAEIEEMAKEKGVSAESDIVDGLFAEQTLNLAKARAVSRIYLYEQERGWLQRLFSQSRGDQIATKAGCEVVLIDEGE